MVKKSSEVSKQYLYKIYPKCIVERLDNDEQIRLYKLNKLDNAGDLLLAGALALTAGSVAAVKKFGLDIDFMYAFYGGSVLTSAAAVLKLVFDSKNTKKAKKNVQSIKDEFPEIVQSSEFVSELQKYYQNYNTPYGSPQPQNYNLDSDIEQVQVQIEKMRFVIQKSFENEAVPSSEDLSRMIRVLQEHLRLKIILFATKKRLDEFKKNVFIDTDAIKKMKEHEIFGNLEEEKIKVFEECYQLKDWLKKYRNMDDSKRKDYGQTLPEQIWRNRA